MVTGRVTCVVIAAGMALSGFAAGEARAQAQDPCIGQLMLFGGNFCPRGWAAAEGQTLSIASNTALFSIYGTTYGGNGQTTFNLPDLRGRAPIHAGQGPGLPPYALGQQSGSPTATLQSQNLPSHTHAVMATDEDGSLAEPGGNVLATEQNAYGPAGGANVAMAPNMIAPSGNNQPFSVQDPILAMQWCVAMQGVFCSRN